MKSRLLFDFIKNFVIKNSQIDLEFDDFAVINSL